MNSSAQALIAARPLALRYSLLALVARLPQIASIQSVEDTRSMLALLPVSRPRLVVLDVDLVEGDSGEALVQIKMTAPETCVVVLVNHIEQQQALQGLAADLVVLKGYPAAELFASVERLLNQNDRGERQ